MDLVDTHCHIQSVGLSQEGERSTRELWAKAPDLTADSIVASAKAADVKCMVCVGCDLADSRLAVQFAQAQDGCWASIGLHPHEAQHYADDAAARQAFAGLVTEDKVIAIGECGLDYFYEHSPRHQQLTVLEFQLQLAQEAGLPVIFHVREAFKDFWPVFDRYKVRGVLHSFTDSADNLAEAVKRGLYIGVNGIATFARDPKQLEVYKSVPLDHLLLETDAPFLTPNPFRGSINEPKQIGVIAGFLAGLRDEDRAILATATTDNARQLFGI
jgi:TatD DNase family protein